MADKALSEMSQKELMREVRKLRASVATLETVLWTKHGQFKELNNRYRMAQLKFDNLKKGVLKECAEWDDADSPEARTARLALKPVLLLAIQ